jgi:hypothetical protein
MKSNRQLDQSLKVAASVTSPGRRSPNVFEYFMRVIEMSTVEEVDAVGKAITIVNGIFHHEIAQWAVRFSKHTAFHITAGVNDPIKRMTVSLREVKQ